MKFGTYKVPGGKMLKVRIGINGSIITEIQLMGDFFLHPEGAILDIEQALVGLEIREESLITSIERILTTKNATLIGATATDIAKVILIAVDS